MGGGGGSGRRFRGLRGVWSCGLFCGGGCQSLGGGRRGMGRGGEAVPGFGDNDVVEGGVAFAEAGEADFEDH